MKLEQLLSAPEEGLAIGVLRQVVDDLRRFQNASGELERELYRDAYRWISENDFSWPYSFINICKLLDVPPEVLRTELLADAALSPLRYWCKVGARFGRCCRASVASAFTPSRHFHRTVVAPQPTHS
jgi:hypothetical protein